MSDTFPKRLQEGRERILKSLHELDLDANQFIPIELLYKSYAHLFGVRFDSEECFRYFETRDRTLVIQRFLSRWIFYAVKLENNVTSRLIFTRQEFKKSDDNSSDQEMIVVNVAAGSHTLSTVGEQRVTPIDKIYLQKATSHVKMTRDSFNLAVKNNAGHYLAGSSFNPSKALFRPETPNDVFRSTQDKYNFLPSQAKATFFPRMNDDPFCPIISATSKSSPNENNFNRSKNLLNSNNGFRQRNNTFYPHKNTSPNMNQKTTQNITQSYSVVGNPKSSFISPARNVSKSSIRRDPPKSLMELTGLPSGPTRGRTLIRSKSISSGLSEDSGISSPVTSHEYATDPFEPSHSRYHLSSVPGGFDERSRSTNPKKSTRSKSLDNKKHMYTVGTTENGEIYSSDDSDI